MTTRKKPEPPPPPPPDVRALTDSIRAASLESTEQIESGRLSKDSGKRIAAALPPVDADPEQEVRSDTASPPSTPGESEE